jgi:hypothetical protein
MLTATHRNPLDGYIVHDLDPALLVRVARPMPALDAKLNATVERIWRKAVQRVAEGGGGALFNGEVFSADRITPTEITGHVTEYRRAVAQMERPALFAALGLRPLAVCGVLRCANGVVFGQRHPAAIYQPGMWQLPPAGSVDSSVVMPDGTVELRGEIEIELAEEVGLMPNQVDPPRPLCVVEHPGSHVCDVGIALTTKLTGAQVRRAHQRYGNAEYAALAIVACSKLADFVDRAGDLLVPPAHEFLRRAGLLPDRACA